MEDTITKTIIVKAGADEAFRAWSNFENFPHFMKYIKSIAKTSDRTSHWEIEGPLGKTVEWDAETTRYEENKRIGWSTKDTHGDLTTSGQVTFNALPQGETELTVTMHYQSQKGTAGNMAARLFSDPGKMLDEDLRNFKDYIEGRMDRITDRQ